MLSEYKHLLGEKESFWTWKPEIFWVGNIVIIGHNLSTNPCVSVTPMLEKNSDAEVKIHPRTLKSVVNYNVILTVLGRLSIFMSTSNSPKTTEPRLWSHKTRSSFSDSELHILGFFCQQSWTRNSDCVSVKSSNRHCPQICSFIYCHWRKMQFDAVLVFLFLAVGESCS